MFVAGEASGDLYGGRLARSLREREPRIRICGIGGPRMREEGVSLFADSRDLAVVGLIEVLSHWRPLREAFRRAVAILKEEPPDLLVLIDYPDFNLRLARQARRWGVPILYFISPQVWAWRSSRVRLIARLVDRILVILPFEEEIYRRAGVPVEFVGHPLLDLLPQPPDRWEAKRILGLDPERPVLGILPGSRRQEIGFHLPAMLEAGALLKERHGNLQMIIPLASTLQKSDLDPHLEAIGSRLSGVRVVSGPPGTALGTMDAAVVKSGTATLEAALMGVPMVLVYRTTSTTYLLASLLARVRHVGLVNIVAGKGLVPELIQGDCTPEGIAGALGPLLNDPARAAALRAELLSLRELLGRPGCFRRVAATVLEILQKKSEARNSRVLQ